MTKTPKNKWYNMGDEKWIRIEERKSGMIEKIYSDEKEDSRDWSKNNIMFRMPKNIRQIGQPDDMKKIYIEDYVMTYARQLAMKDYSNYQVTVLLGQFIKIDGVKSIFISGAVEVKDARIESTQTFSNEVWTDIYEDVKEYFKDVEIVGWYISKAGMPLEITENILKMHIDNFAGQDKTLLMYDCVEKEESFYVYHDNNLLKQKGYYIYYEKNEAMQDYMVDHKHNSSIDEGYEDIAMREIRQVLNTKKEKFDEREQKSLVSILYVASTLLAIVVLIIGATMLNSYEQMKNIEQALGVITEKVMQQDKEPAQVKQPITNVEEPKITEIETMSGNIEKIKEGFDEIEEEVKPKRAVPEENIVSQEKVVSQEDNEKIKAEQKVETKEVVAPAKKKKEVAKQVTRPKYYTIKEGDSLITISKKYYNSVDYVDDILKANKIEDQDMILIGQKIVLP